jgi:cytochrome P450
LPKFDAFLDTEFWQDPYPAMAEAQRAGSPLYRSSFGVIALGFDFTTEIAKNPRFGVPTSQEALEGFAQPLVDAFEYSLLHINPPEHTERRRIVARRFGATPVRDLTPLVETTVDRLLDELIERGAADFLTVTAGPLTTRTFCSLLDVPLADEPLIERWTGDMVGGLKMSSDADSQRTAGIASQSVLDYLGELASDRLSKGGRDALSIILEGFSEAGYEEPARIAAATFAQVMMDGIESIKNAIGNGLYALLLHPEAFAALGRDPSLVPSATEEMLRWDGPTLLTGRRVLEELNFHGVALSAGTPVSLIWLAANRDPARFPNPHDFDIRRKNNRHAAFGGGIHSCAGANLARIQLRTFFDKFARRIGSVELTEPRPQWQPFSIARGLERLPIRVQAN